MISTTASLPLPAPAPDDFTPAGSPDTARDDSDSISFSSRLDQQINQRDSQQARPADARPTAAPRDDSALPSDADSVAASSSPPAADSLSTPAAPDPAPAEGAPPRQSPETKKSERAKSAAASEDTDKAQNEAASSSAPPLALPFTPAALALANGIIPVPAAPVLVTTKANGPADGAAVYSEARLQSFAISGASLPAVPTVPSVTNGAAVGQTAVHAASAFAVPAAPGLTGAVPAAPALRASPAVPTSALPLTSSGVPMDSRANGQTAAPGVDNAIPQTAAANPLAVNTPAQTGAGVPSVVSASGSPTAIAAPDAANPPTAGVTASAANTLAVGNAAVVSALASASVTPIAAPAPVQPPVATPQTASQTAAQIGAASIAQANPPALSASQGAAILAPTGAASEKQPDSTVGGQRLDGIHRLLTLNTAKNAGADNPPVDAGEESPARSGANGAAATPLAARNAEVSDLTGLPATAAVPVKSVSYAQAAGVPSGVSSGISSMAQPKGNAAASADAGTGAVLSTGSGAEPGTGGIIALRPGSLPQALASGQAVVGSPASAAARDASSVSVGADSFGAAAAPSGGASASSADAGGQEQSQAQGRPQADIPPPSGEAVTDGAAANALTATRDAGETAAAASTASAGGSSQIDRAHVVAQVTRHLEGMRLSGGNGEMSLRLAPQHLGSVQVTVSAHQDGVIARIAVESVQVQQAMESAKEHLRGTLEARGLHVRNVEVTVTPYSAGHDSATYNGQRNRQANAERPDMPGSYTRRDTSRIAATASAGQTVGSASAAMLSASRLDYRA